MEKVELVSDKQLILFRIIQEALQNVIKHSKANKVLIRISEKEHVLYISIADNGVGYHPEQTATAGMGIRHMHKRAEILGGSMHLTTGDFGQGLSVHLSIPLSYENT